MKVHTILIVDDHDIFRGGLREIISHWEEFKVVGEAANGKEAIGQVEKCLPDIVIMDISMPIMNGLEATKRISRKFPSTQIAMLTVAEGEKNLFEAIRNGASGYMSKNVSAEKFYELLNDLARGDAALTSDMAKKILDEFITPSRETKPVSEKEPLSEREEQILALIVEGLSNSEIGERIYLSPNTVKKHIRNILQKLHVNNRIEAAVYAVREGLVD